MSYSIKKLLRGYLDTVECLEGEHIEELADSKGFLQYLLDLCARGGWHVSMQTSKGSGNAIVSMNKGLESECFWREVDSTGKTPIAALLLKAFAKALATTREVEKGTEWVGFEGDRIEVLMVGPTQLSYRSSDGTTRAMLKSVFLDLVEEGQKGEGKLRFARVADAQQ